MKSIHVVAAVLKDPRGRVFINQRPAGKSWAGYWEFPGGKIEAGEALLAALTRELHEELGVTVRDAQPWIHLSHDYPEFRVELHVWRVQSYDGVPQARENQTLAWVKPGELSGWNLLPADAPIVTAIRLPPLMLVTPSAAADRKQFLQHLESAVTRGVDFIQLRAPELGVSEYRLLAREAIAICHRHAGRIVLNTNPEIAYELGADGAHLSNARLLHITGRPLPEDFLVGASCHDEAGILRASASGLDYILLGPVQTTPTHPQATILGWDGFMQLASCSLLPVYAVGGMLPGYLDRIRTLGGHGIAAMRGLWDTQAPVSS